MKNLSILFVFFLMFFASSCSCKKVDNNKLTIIIVRHGESYKNLKPVPTDLSKEKLDSLTPKGVEQIEKIGLALQKEKVAAIFASPTGRTKQTAQIIATTIKAKEEIVESGALVSLKNGIDEKGAANTMEWREAQWNLNLDPKPTDGESMQDGSLRLLAFVNQKFNKYKGQTIVVVTHGDICAALIGQALHTPYHLRFKENSIPTGSISTITISDHGWGVIKK